MKSNNFAICFNLLLYVSLLFLAWHLYRHEYLVIPKIVSISALVFSVAALISGFFLTITIWQKFLANAGFTVRWPDCLAAQGLSVFGKYIPGKLWVLVGMTGYIAQQYGLPASHIALVALRNQFSQLWVGLILGIVGLIWAGGNWQLVSLSAIPLGILTVALFSRTANTITAKLLQKILGKNLTIPVFLYRDLLPLLPYLVSNWLLWGVGFYLLASSIFATPVPLATGLGFVISATLGVLAVFAPGGLGVREGILAGFLIQLNFTPTQVATLTVISRLWFLIGEVIMFILGAFFSKLRKIEHIT